MANQAADPKISLQDSPRFHDFNHKNFALIGGVFALLLVFAVVQGVQFRGAHTLVWTLGHEVSVFAPAPSASQQVASTGSQPAVLGASTLDANTEAQLASLPITVGSADTVAAGTTYASQVSVVLQADATNPAKAAQDLTALAVPPSLARYQRLAILRADLQAELATDSAANQQQLQATISAISSEIGSIQSTFAAQGVNLPS